MIIVIGEILIDHFPEYERIGGAPFNFAYHLKQLGYPVRFITRIGDDANGRHILHQLAEHKFNLEDVQIDIDHPTGVVNISLDHQGVPQFEICKDVAYDHIDLSSLPTPEWTKIRMLYFGTLAQRTQAGFEHYKRFIDRKPPSVHGFCDINLRAPHLNREAIKASLNQADILKLNGDEMSRIGAFFNGPQPQEALIQWTMESFNIKLMALTQGDQGSNIISNDGVVSTGPKHLDAIIDTVGAGDAYAAVLASGLLERIPLTRTLDLATEFSAHICMLQGAVPENGAPYHQLRKQLGKDK